MRSCRNASRLRNVLSALLFLLAQSAAAEPTQKPSDLGPAILRSSAREKHIEHGILTPLPINVELPSELPARRVLVHYKLWGAKEWTTLELARVGNKYTGAIPCLEVSTITGDIKYYVRVHDVLGGVIAYAGSRHAPFIVTVKNKSSSGRGRCPDPADCPAGLPGCPSERVEKIPCRTDLDCEGGDQCSWDGYCEPNVRRRNAFTVEVAQAFGVVSTTGACRVSSQENEGYLCRRQFDGQTYVGNPVYTNEPLRTGVSLSRIVIGYERVIFYNTSIGAKFGYAIAGDGPTVRGGQSFVPFSAELRAAYWFGNDPFVNQRFRPHVYLSTGFAMFDVRTTVRVRENPLTGLDQGDNDLEQELDVWKRTGDAFVGIGGGAVYMLSSGLGVSGELSVLQLFPYGGAIIQPALGARVAF